MDPNAAQAAQAGSIGFIIVAGIFAVAIYLVIGALLLKAACWICREDQPTLGSAMAIVFSAFLTQCGVGFVFKLAFGSMLGETSPAFLLCNAALNIFVSGAVVSAMLPTSLGKGILMMFLQIVILIVICLTPAFLLAGLTLWKAQPGRSNPAVPAAEAPNIADNRPDADQQFFADALREIQYIAPNGSQARVPAAPANRRNRAIGSQAEATGGDEISRLISQLDEPEKQKVSSAADRLGRLRADETRRAEVSAKLLPLLEDPDDLLRMTASSGLKTWADAEAVPVLIRAVGDSNVFVRHNVIETLGRMKDARAADALVAHIKSDKIPVIAALKKMGPAAEPAVLTALGDEEWTIRSSACDILSEIGTGLSVPELRKHVRDENGIVRMRAEAALKKIGNVAPPAVSPSPDDKPAPKTTTKKKRRL